MRRFLLLISAIFIAACGAGPKQGPTKGPAAAVEPDIAKHGQAVEGDMLKDYDYGFELKKPSADWVFLGEDDAAELNPEAIAGLYHPELKIFTVVLAEELPGASIEDYAALLVGNIPFEDKNIVFSKQVGTGGVKAHQFKVEGLFNGAQYVFFNTIYPRGAFYFQVGTWMPQGSALKIPGGSAYIHPSFAFMKGVKPKTRAPKKADTMLGTGWRVEGDVYENAIFGFRFALPEKGWRFMGKAELRKVNPNAALGITNVQSGLIAIVIAEKLGKMTKVDFDKLMKDSFIKENKPQQQKMSMVKVGEQNLSAHLFEQVAMENIVLDFSLVTLKKDTTGCQILAWWAHSRQEKALLHLPGIYSGFSWLPEVKRAALAGELMALGAAERLVAPGESFRDNVYRNFDFGFSLSLPEGFWKGSIGADAAKESEDASIVLENMKHGLYAAIELEEEGTDAEAYHADVLEDMKAPTGITTGTIESTGLKILFTRFTLKGKGKAYTYHVATATRGTKHVRMLMHGFADNLDETKELETAMIKGMALSDGADHTKAFLDDGTYRDYRLGFSVGLPAPGWKIEDVTAQQVEGTGSYVHMYDPLGLTACVAGAIHTEVDTQTFAHDMFGRLDELRKLKLEPLAEKSSTWLGLPSRLTVFEDSLGKAENPVEIMTVTIGGTLFFFAVVNESSAFSPEDLRGLFELIP